MNTFCNLLDHEIDWRWKVEGIVSSLLCPCRGQVMRISRSAVLWLFFRTGDKLGDHEAWGSTFTVTGTVRHYQRKLLLLLRHITYSHGISECLEPERSGPENQSQPSKTATMQRRTEGYENARFALYCLFFHLFQQKCPPLLNTN